ncbi:MAG: DUF1573 domain-containing protein [Nanoarchaeota archaeon]|nr:DUF1573 domain-containing protein [Nanoarchaeota archaeon]
MKSKESPGYKRRTGLGLALIIILSAAFISYSEKNQHISMDNGSKENTITLGSTTKSPQEYYKMFQCACCGQPINTGCCGMAEQGKSYLDSLINQNLDEEEILSMMVKQFDFGVLMDPSKEAEIREYILGKAGENSPKIKMDKESHYFGEVRQSEGIVSTTFTITNTGKTDLIIEKLDTSCMCTSASLIYDGKESKVFGMSMHDGNPEDFSLKISPGNTAELKVYYDPNTHGEQKEDEIKVKREVYINTNDPVDFRKKVRIELIQQRG